MKVKIKIRYFLKQHWKSHVCEVDVNPKLNEDSRNLELWDASKKVLLEKYKGHPDVSKISITQLEVVDDGIKKA